MHGPDSLGQEYEKDAYHPVLEAGTGGSRVFPRGAKQDILE